MDALIADLRRSGVLERSKQKVRALLAEAEAALAVLPDRPARALLLDVARRLSDRKL
ncbi:MAG: hypothetical protein IPN23_02290 [Elusimicrobia bacterium]|nr:hypothetical protein [Elusimicrobiota bacterium]